MSFLAAVSLWACAGGGAVVMTEVAGEGKELPDIAGEAGKMGPETVLEVVEEPVGPPTEVLDWATPDEQPFGCLPGEGCFLDPCELNSDCQSGWCVEHMGDGVCSDFCQEECPPGWTCKQVAGTGPDLIFVCVSDVANLCKPCGSSSDCKSIGGVDDVCVDYGDEGAFCGGACDENGECPDGFSCNETVTVDGIITTQCVNLYGVCECTEKSIALSLWTPCSQQNEFGLCEGKRVCMQEGLGDCDAAVPYEEECDGADNNCDGDVDEDTCDDGVECTEDTCLGEEGCLNSPLTGEECKDGDICTVADHCEDGVCIGTPVICDDQNPCTDDACAEDGGCVFTPNLAQCDDGDPCTVADTCQEGECAGVAVDCDCQSDEECEGLEDDDMCNGTLYCDTTKLPHLCKVDPDTLIECPEPEGFDAPCLAPACEPLTGECFFESIHDAFACDDGDACTIGDKCGSGICLPGTDVNCNDGNECTDDSCDPDTGCVHTQNEAPCQDGDVCTVGDQCGGGECLSGGALDCDDGNVCTDDSCDPAIGCVHESNHLACDDGNACTTGDQCSEGSCVGGNLPDCDDGNVCTTDWCEPAAGCLNDFNSAPCDDDDLCTMGDQCSGGECVSGDQLDCDDGNVCTDDLCNALAGCVHSNNVADCDDNNTCTTGDSCVDGKCVGAGAMDCDDDNSCTKDICLPDGGCAHEENMLPCSDGDACTVGDKCEGGTCIPGVAMDCDDGNVCTVDSCDPNGACIHDANSALCDDGNACTENDQCKGGKCSGSMVDCDDDNICTDDWCDPVDGCKYNVNANPCDDGDVCTTSDKCGGGWCVSGAPLNCNDGNECTDDGCDPQDGCTHINNVLDCSDGNVCTTADKCAAGFCVGGPVQNCDDGNPCTDDSCDPALGCVHTPNGNGCNDGNACTTNDQCKGGSCVGGAPPNCDDGNVCTDDYCDVNAGCVHGSNSAPCTDNNACTANDTCAMGVCVPGAAVVCNDNNPCTNDSCNPAAGCQFVNNGNACNDNNACTTNDHCSGGLCTGSVLNCNDGNQCTSDSCNPATGCVYMPISPCCGNGVKEGGEECDDGNTNNGDGCSSVCKTEGGVCQAPSVLEGNYCWVHGLNCGESHAAACSRVGKTKTGNPLTCGWSKARADAIAGKLGNSIYKACCANTMFCNNSKCRVDNYSDPYHNWNGCIDGLPPLYSCNK